MSTDDFLDEIPRKRMQVEDAQSGDEPHPYREDEDTLEHLQEMHSGRTVSPGLPLGHLHRALHATG